MQVLLVEDDVGLSEAVVSGLGSHGISVTHADGLMSGRRAWALGSFDVVILDVMLPDGNGFDLCRRRRREGDETPVLMLTARDTVEDRVRGLDDGADDYLVKPFAFDELVARIRALAREQLLLALLVFPTLLCVFGTVPRSDPAARARAREWRPR